MYADSMRNYITNGPRRVLRPREARISLSRVMVPERSFPFKVCIKNGGKQATEGPEATGGLNFPIPAHAPKLVITFAKRATEGPGATGGPRTSRYALQYR